MENEDLLVCALNNSEIECQEVVIGIENEDQLHLPSRSKCCIYKVPRVLREINPAAYTPQLVSIGPFHFHDEQLRKMHKYKIKYLQDFCQKTEKTQNDMFKKIKGFEERIRSCYEELPSIIEKSNSAKDNINSLKERQEFLKLIFLDSVFIIELFLKNRYRDKDDFILNGLSMRSMVGRDLLLLENQLPYFVLKELYEFAIPNHRVSFFRIACEWFEEFNFLRNTDENPKSIHSYKCFSNFLYCFWMSKCHVWCQERLKTKKQKGQEMDNLIEKIEKESEPLDQDNQVKHFTDLIRKFRSDNHPKTNGKFITYLYSATKLHNVGVKFKVGRDASPLDVKFKNGQLIMPVTIFDDSTEIFIRNLMAFKQCQYPDNTYICNYFVLLDFLINTRDDVSVLCESGVVVNLLGHDKNLAKMINKLCDQITLNGGYGEISDSLNEHCKNGWYQTVAIMRRVYFSNLWRGTGTLAAILLIFLTFMQSLDAIRKYFG